ncbi:MAG: PTS sugar transporter subunit IIB [Streptococcaceae bacterium]|jgi:PTS system cellobiose-specific IIB component|nr:PTS sugar transporter subunit IIB [Streptococcaceae bacterium]
MSKKNIMLVCSAGMSTSLLVTKIEKAALEQNIDANIFAVSASEADSKIADEKIDVLLLGPQVRFMEKQFNEKVSGKDIPVEVINMSDYGLMNGENVLKRAVDLINK